MATDPQAGRPKQPAKAKAKPAGGPAAQGHPDRPYWAALLLTLAGLVVMLGVEWALGQTPAKPWIDSIAESMPAHVPSPGQRDEVPVAVIDLHDVKAAPSSGSFKTPRGVLFALTRAALEAGATAVAIDIDFGPVHADVSSKPDSPEELMARNEELEFLDNIRELLADWERRNDPKRVVLGVHRSVGSGPDGWLYDRDFSALAGHMSLPRKGIRVPLAVEIVDRGQRWQLPSLSAALAGVGPAEIERGGTWLLETYRERRRKIERGPNETQIRFTDYLIDARLAEKFATGFIGTNPDQSLGYGTVVRFSASDLNRLDGALVVIGDVYESAGDQVQVTGIDQVVPGAAVHAAGAATLVARPYRSVRKELAHVFDIGFSFMAVSLAYVLRSIYSRRRVDLSAERLNRALTRLFVGACLLGGLGLAWALRVVWDGFLWAALSLPVGNLLEERIPGFAKALDRAIIKAGGGTPE